MKFLGFWIGLTKLLTTFRLTKAIHSALTHLPPGTILLGYPIPNGFQTDPLVWQANEGMPYDLVAGYGFIPACHGTTPIGSLPASPAVTAYEDAQVGILPPTPDPSTVAGVRSDLARWHVGVVVEYAGYGGIEQPKQLAALVDAATGLQPKVVDGAYVWRLP